MKLNEEGINLIKSFESCRLRAYPDPATGGDPWTIGYGCTGPDITEGVEWTQEEAEEGLMIRLSRLTKSLSQVITTSLNDNQFSAIVSLVYNIGLGNFAKSTLLKKLIDNDLIQVSNEFLKWDKAKGKEMNGLLRRREAEQKLFNS